MGAIFKFPEGREESQNLESEQNFQTAAQTGDCQQSSALKNRPEDLELTAAKEVETWMSTWGTEI